MPSDIKSVMGIEGGRALTTAKYIAWRGNLPLFQVSTIISINAAFTHKADARIKGVVRYIGWVIPQVVYVDHNIIKITPHHLNRAGVGDVFCIYTALYDWKLTTKRGKKVLWPWDEEVAEEAKKVLRMMQNSAEDNSECYRNRH